MCVWGLCPGYAAKEQPDHQGPSITWKPCQKSSNAHPGMVYCY